MNLGQLAKAIAERFGLSDGEARRLLAFILETAAGNLRAGRRVYLRGFGAFAKRIRPGRWFKNPRTGERTWIPPRPYVAFSASPGVLRPAAARKRRRPAPSKRRD